MFFDLATWHLIPWRYTAQGLREAQALRTDYADRRLHARLMHVLDARLGHRVAYAVERAKIAASRSDADAPLPLDWIEPGLAATLSPAAMRDDLHALLARVVACAQACVRLAQLQPGQIDALYLTGGSSALRPLRQALTDAFPGTPQVEGDLFGGVAAGLAVSGG